MKHLYRPFHVIGVVHQLSGHPIQIADEFFRYCYLDRPLVRSRAILGSLVILWWPRKTQLAEIAEYLWGCLPNEIAFWTLDQSGQAAFGSRLKKSFRDLDRCRPECGRNFRGAISSNLKVSDHAARSIG